MKHGYNLYAGLLDGETLSEAILKHAKFKINFDDSGFDKTLLLVSERHELLLLASAMAEFILLNDAEEKFKSFLF